jgi:hypothetical protein
MSKFRNMVGALKQQVQAVGEKVVETASEKVQATGEKVVRVAGDKVQAAGDKVQAVSEKVQATGEKVVQAASDNVQAAGHKVPSPVHAAGHKVARPVHAAGDKVARPVHAAGDKVARPVHAAGDKVARPVHAAGDKVAMPFRALKKEAKLGPALHAEVLAALKDLQKKHPDIKKVLAESAGYAVIPSIGRAALVLGGAYGIGEVFVHDRVIGYAALVELTVGIQVGRSTFHELIVFRDDDALKSFKGGKLALAANAALAMVKVGAQASRGFGKNSSIYVFAEGGMLLDLAIGAQKFIFKPAALGRARTANDAFDEETQPDSVESDREDEPRAAPAQEERHGHHPG